MSTSYPLRGSVLIVDDEENIRLTVSEAMREAGLEPTTASNGSEALALLESEAFDLLLIDLKIPEPDGMEVLRWARENRPGMAAIVITAYGTAFDAVEAVEIGAADFIAKPFSLEEIHRHVTRVLSQAGEDFEAADYDASVPAPHGSARINDRQFDAAAEFVYEAIRSDGARPEPYDLLGTLYRLRGDYPEAQRCFEKALSLDFGYAPALRNLRELPDHGRADQESTESA